MNICLEIFIRYIGIGIILMLIEVLTVVILSNFKLLRKLKNDPINYAKNLSEALHDVDEAYEGFKSIGMFELLKLSIWVIVCWPKALCTVGWFIYTKIKTN